MDVFICLILFACIVLIGMYIFRKRICAISLKIGGKLKLKQKHAVGSPISPPGKHTVGSPISSPGLTKRFERCNLSLSVLIVDVANVFPRWYKKKYNTREVPYIQQPGLMRSYLQCMKDIKKDNIQFDIFHFVIKNYKYFSSVSNRMIATHMTDSTKNAIQQFADTSPRIRISLATDYRIYPKYKWTDPKFHYLRGRDDHTCFILSQHYYTKYLDPIIMSNDKFRDFYHFGYVPSFLVETFSSPKNKLTGHSSPKNKLTGRSSPKKAPLLPEYKEFPSSKIINPRRNALGQLQDYAIIPSL